TECSSGGHEVREWWIRRVGVSDTAGTRFGSSACPTLGAPVARIRTPRVHHSRTYRGAEGTSQTNCESPRAHVALHRARPFCGRQASARANETELPDREAGQGEAAGGEAVEGGRVRAGAAGIGDEPADAVVVEGGEQLWRRRAECGLLAGQPRRVPERLVGPVLRSRPGRVVVA